MTPRKAFFAIFYARGIHNHSPTEKIILSRQKVRSAMKIYLVTDKIIDSPISLLHGLTVKEIPGDGGGGAFIEWVVECNMKTFPQSVPPLL